MSLALLTDVDKLSAPALMRTDALPEGLALALTAIGAWGPTVEHRRLLAYEIEWQTREGLEVEILADQNGVALATVVEPADEELERVVSADQIPSAAREAVAQLVPDTMKVEMKREVEWGLPVHTVAWTGPRGIQELKVMDDGRVLFIELPKDEPIPEPVRRLAAGLEVEALLLDIYSMPLDADGSSSPAVLAAGWPIALASH